MVGRTVSLLVAAARTTPLLRATSRDVSPPAAKRGPVLRSRINLRTTARSFLCLSTVTLGPLSCSGIACSRLIVVGHPMAVSARILGGRDRAFTRHGQARGDSVSLENALGYLLTTFASRRSLTDAPPSPSLSVICTVAAGERD